MSAMTPREIVQELDKHIVGQGAAKRAVAIALRDRWRRMQVEESLRAEITPKNILMNGALASFASRRAISVLPTPVGPIIRMFLGVISARSASSTCLRRQRLRSAMATARLAAPCPTMCLSSSWTISRGVMEDMVSRG